MRYAISRTHCLSMKTFSRAQEMLFDAVSHKKQQTIMRYTNVTLKINLNDELVQGTLLYEAIVDWKHCKMIAYMDYDDKINNIPCFDGHFTIPCDQRLFIQYLVETFLFIKRGHSLLDDKCTCHKDAYIIREMGTASRLNELGYSQKKSTSTIFCGAENNRKMASYSSIECELGLIESTHGTVIVNGSSMNFFDALVKYGNFKVVNIDNTIYLYSDICCIPENLKSILDVLKAVQVCHPQPFCYEDHQTIEDQLIRKDIIKQLRILEDKNFIRIIPGAKQNSLSCFLGSIHDLKTDPDLKKLWHQTKVFI